MVGSIDASVVAGLERQFAAAGLDPRTIARAAGLSRGTAPARGGVALAHFVALLEAAARLGDDPGLAWRLGRGFVPAAMFELFPAIGGATLGELLRNVIEAIARLQSGSLLRMTVGPSLTIVDYRVLDPAIWPRARDAEFTFGFLEGIVRHFACDDFRPEGLVFEHEDASAGLDRTLGIACVYAHTINQFALPTALLALPTRGPPRITGVPPPPAIEGDRDLRTRLRLAILSLIGEDDIDQARVAALCGLSQRTLRRRLGQQTLRFRDEIEAVRMDYARATLLHTSLPLAEIARRLGYSQQSDFSRAFRRAEGLTPSSLRRGFH